VERGLIVMSAKRIALNFYRCFADINIVTKKAYLSSERDAKPRDPLSEAAGFPINGYAEHLGLFFS
jgi:hypothetical protein